MKYLYIAGYGRSGSTLLERLLSQENSVVGGGELYFLEQFLLGDLEQNELICACEQTVRNCPFWSPVVRGIEESSNITNGGFFWPDFINKYSSQNIELIIDSSKTPYNRLMYFYDKLSHDNVYVYHLHRSLSGTLASVAKGGNDTFGKELVRSKFLSQARSTIHWILANFVAYSSRFFVGERSLSSSYREICRSPERIVRRVENLLDIELFETFSDDIKLGQTHQVAGNRLRFKDEVQIEVRDE